MRQHFTKLFQYDAWANTTLADTLQRQNNLPDRARALFSHLLLSQQIWFERVEGKRASRPFWQELPDEELRELIISSGSKWQEFVAVVPQHQFRSMVTYVNSQGETFTSTILDIMAHVINHSTHHRAQIVQLIRQSGGEPPQLDYIVYARSVAPPEH